MFPLVSVIHEIIDVRANHPSGANSTKPRKASALRGSCRLVGGRVTVHAPLGVRVDSADSDLRREEVAMAGKAKSSSGSRGRSAITGRFVKQSTVKSHPKTTINESSKKKGK